MTHNEFIFILILLIIFCKFNATYEKKHDDKSILDESKVKKTIHDFSLLDIITRFTSDILIVS